MSSENVQTPRGVWRFWRCKGDGLLKQGFNDRMPFLAVTFMQQMYENDFPHPIRSRDSRVLIICDRVPPVWNPGPSCMEASEPDSRLFYHNGWQQASGLLVMFTFSCDYFYIEWMNRVVEMIVIGDDDFITNVWCMQLQPSSIICLQLLQLSRSICLAVCK